MKNVPQTFNVPDARFNHIHVDIVGPLPSSRGYNYLLTVVDRYSRWPEAYSIKDSTAETVAQALYAGWICRYGSQKIITTDQGVQFESHLFNALLKFIGADRIRTTSYHPASNGLVERWHRSLKAALMCHGSKFDWYDTLPTVLLGLRTSERESIRASPAEYLFGTTLRVPDEFFSKENPEVDPQKFLVEHKKHMSDLKPVPVNRHGNVKTFIY